ncbi:MAG: tryptophan synthase subunit alpha [Bacteroidota bacterium]
MNRIKKLFQDKSGDILSIFFTAGHPNLNDGTEIISELAQAGVDLVEIGMPYSDPIADGSTIQASSFKALQNGMSIQKLFEQLQGIREKVDIPLILMGYINPVLQFGIEKFCQEAEKVGIDGLILPDLPMAEYLEFYKDTFEAHGLSNVFLITPQTSEERIRLIDKVSNSFIYVVSTDSTTGKTEGFNQNQVSYFKKIQDMNLNNPYLIGFGISDHQSFKSAANHAQGAIIGSAFIKALEQPGSIKERVQTFVHKIRGLEYQH